MGMPGAVTTGVAGTGERMTSSIRSFVITTATAIIRFDDMDGATAVLNISTIVVNTIVVNTIVVNSIVVNPTLQ